MCLVILKQTSSDYLKFLNRNILIVHNRELTSIYLSNLCYRPNTLFSLTSFLDPVAWLLQEYNQSFKHII